MKIPIEVVYDFGWLEKNHCETTWIMLENIFWHLLIGMTRYVKQHYLLLKHMLRNRRYVPPFFKLFPSPALHGKGIVCLLFVLLQPGKSYFFLQGLSQFVKHHRCKSSVISVFQKWQEVFRELRCILDVSTWDRKKLPHKMPQTTDWHQRNTQDC